MPPAGGGMWIPAQHDRSFRTAFVEAHAPNLPDALPRRVLLSNSEEAAPTQDVWGAARPLLPPSSPASASAPQPRPLLFPASPPSRIQPFFPPPTPSAPLPLSPPTPPLSSPSSPPQLSDSLAPPTPPIRRLMHMLRSPSPPSLPVMPSAGFVGGPIPAHQEGFDMLFLALGMMLGGVCILGARAAVRAAARCTCHDWRTSATRCQHRACTWLGSRSPYKPQELLLPRCYERSDAAQYKQEARSKTRKGESMTELEARKLSLQLCGHLGLAVPPAREEWEEVVQRVDKHGSGFVSRDALRLLVRKELKLAQSTISDSKLKALHRWLDPYDCDAITLADFELFLTMHSRPMHAATRADPSPLQRAVHGKLFIPVQRTCNEVGAWMRRCLSSALSRCSSRSAAKGWRGKGRQSTLHHPKRRQNLERKSPPKKAPPLPPPVGASPLPSWMATSHPLGRGEAFALRVRDLPADHLSPASTCRCGADLCSRRPSAPIWPMQTEEQWRAATASQPPLVRMQKNAALRAQARMAAFELSLSAESAPSPAPRTAPSPSSPTHGWKSPPAEGCARLHGGVVYREAEAFWRLTLAQRLLQEAIDARKEARRLEESAVRARKPRVKKIAPLPHWLAANVSPPGTKPPPPRRLRAASPLPKEEPVKKAGVRKVVARNVPRPAERKAAPRQPARGEESDGAALGSWSEGASDEEGAQLLRAQLCEDAEAEAEAEAAVGLARHLLALPRAWRTLWSRVRLPILPTDEARLALGEALERHFPSLFDVFARYAAPADIVALESGPFLLSRDGWLAFASDAQLPLPRKQQEAIFDRVASAPLDLPRFLEALIGAAVALRPPRAGKLTTERLVRAADDLVTDLVLAHASRAGVLSFRVVMLSSVAVPQALDVLGVRLRQIFAHYAAPDGTMDARELLKLARDCGLLEQHISQPQVVAAFAYSLPVGTAAPGMLRYDGSFEECVLRMALSYEAVRIPPASIDLSRSVPLHPKEEAMVLQRLAVLVHTLSDVLVSV